MQCLYMLVIVFLTHLILSKLIISEHSDESDSEVFNYNPISKKSCDAV